MLKKYTLGTCGTWEYIPKKIHIPHIWIKVHYKSGRRGYCPHQYNAGHIINTCTTSITYENINELTSQELLQLMR